MVSDTHSQTDRWSLEIHLNDYMSSVYEPQAWVNPTSAASLPSHPHHKLWTLERPRLGHFCQIVVISKLLVKTTIQSEDIMVKLKLRRL